MSSGPAGGAPGAVRQVMPRWPPPAVPSGTPGRYAGHPARCFRESAQLERSALLKTATGAVIH